MLEEVISPNLDFPNEEVKYQQNMEEMKQLVPFLKEEMKSCPTDNFVFTLIRYFAYPNIIMATTARLASDFGSSFEP